MLEQIAPLKRQIVISRDIDESLAGEIIEQIIEISDYDDQMSVVSTYEPQPIEIFINSGGGGATDGFAIVDAMEMCNTPIITYGLGSVASMALAIFVAGDVRVASRHTRFMYHSVSFGTMGKIKDHEDRYKEADTLQKMYDDLLLEKTEMKADFLSSVREKKVDFFFSAAEAMELGVADQLGQKTPIDDVGDVEEE